MSFGAEGRLRAFDSCASTNDEALAWAAAGAPHGAVVVADRQTAGRGQKGRTWADLGGEQLFVSIVLRPPLTPAEMVPFTLAAGLAVAATLQEFSLQPALKWPNDVLLEGRKVAGVLTEMVSRGGHIEALIVGVGLNLNITALPDELREIATAMAPTPGARVDRDEVLAALLAQMAAVYDRFVGGDVAGIVRDWKAFATFIGRRIVVTNGATKIEGEALDVDASGVLTLRDATGRVHRILSGTLA